MPDSSQAVSSATSSATALGPTVLPGVSLEAARAIPAPTPVSSMGMNVADSSVRPFEELVAERSERKKDIASVLDHVESVASTTCLRLSTVALEVAGAAAEAAGARVLAEDTAIELKSLGAFLSNRVSDERIARLSAEAQLQALLAKQDQALAKLTGQAAAHHRSPSHLFVPDACSLCSCTFCVRRFERAYTSLAKSDGSWESKCAWADDFPAGTRVLVSHPGWTKMRRGFAFARTTGMGVHSINVRLDDAIPGSDHWHWETTSGYVQLDHAPSAPLPSPPVSRPHTVPISESPMRSIRVQALASSADADGSSVVTAQLSEFPEAVVAEACPPSPLAAPLPAMGRERGRPAPPTYATLLGADWLEEPFDEGSSEDEPLYPGDRVRLCGMVRRPALNGRRGVQTHYHAATKRLQVTLDDDTILLLKHGNIMVLEAAPSVPSAAPGAFVDAGRVSRHPTGGLVHPEGAAAVRTSQQSTAALTTLKQAKATEDPAHVPKRPVRALPPGVPASCAVQERRITGGSVSTVPLSGAADEIPASTGAGSGNEVRGWPSGPNLAKVRRKSLSELRSFLLEWESAPDPPSAALLDRVKEEVRSRERQQTLQRKRDAKRAGASASSLS